MRGSSETPSADSVDMVVLVCVVSCWFGSDDGMTFDVEVDIHRAKCSEPKVGSDYVM